MRIHLAALVLLVTVIGQPASAEDGAKPARLVSEAEVRLVSDALYTELVRQAFNKGWRFSWDQIERGYRRHFNELKLQLIDKGYVIVVGEAGV